MTDFNKLLDSLGEDYDMTARMKKFGAGADALTNFGGLLLDYQADKTDSYALEVQASQVELQAQQRINQIREGFNSAVGTATFNATRRGVVAEGGSLGKNIEESSIALGKDAVMAKKNARAKASAMRSKAKINKILRKGAFVSGLLNLAGSVAGGFAGSGSGTKSLQVKPGIKPAYRG